MASTAQNKKLRIDVIVNLKDPRSAGSKEIVDARRELLTYKLPLRKENYVIQRPFYFGSLRVFEQTYPSNNFTLRTAKIPDNFPRNEMIRLMSKAQHYIIAEENIMKNLFPVFSVEF